MIAATTIQKTKGVSIDNQTAFFLELRGIFVNLCVVGNPIHNLQTTNCRQTNIMKGKTTLLIIVTGLITFILGWFLRGTIRPSNQTKDTRVINAFIDTVSQADTIKRNNFVHTVSGHFILNESNCAGFNFINKDIVLWTNEIACNDPDTLKLRWLSDSTFMTRSTLRINVACPPRVDVYKVVSFDGKHLILNSVWTGWNDNKDEKLELQKQAK